MSLIKRISLNILVIAILAEKCGSNVKVSLNFTGTIKSINDKLDVLADHLTLQENEMNKKQNDLAGLLKPLSSCADAFAHPFLNRGNGIYNIQLDGKSSLSAVYCIADPRGGLPWMLVQRRIDGSTDFNRNWAEYRSGFGELENEFFIGLENLHSLTTQGEPQELWIRLTDSHGNTRHAFYDRFAIGTEIEEYPLMVLGEYSGDAGDSLSYHRSMKFSTYDNNNDHALLWHCARHFKSGWWFNSCHSEVVRTLIFYNSYDRSNLNGEYGTVLRSKGLKWTSLNKPLLSIEYAHMAIRPVRK